MEATTHCEHLELRTYVRGKPPIIGCVLCGSSREEAEGEQLQLEPPRRTVMMMSEAEFQVWLGGLRRA